jgi:hypothetical protein
MFLRSQASLLLLLGLISSFEQAQAYILEVYTGTGFSGAKYESHNFEPKFHQGRCSNLWVVQVPRESFGSQFSIKSASGFVCDVARSGQENICVDAEGWGNITDWGNVLGAYCYTASRSWCSGSKIEFSTAPCGRG